MAQMTSAVLREDVLDVLMDNVLLVAVVNDHNELLEEPPRHVFSLQDKPTKTTDGPHISTKTACVGEWMMLISFHSED